MCMPQDKGIMQASSCPTIEKIPGIHYVENVHDESVNAERKLRNGNNEYSVTLPSLKYQSFSTMESWCPSSLIMIMIMIHNTYLSLGDLLGAPWSLISYMILIQNLKKNHPHPHISFSWLPDRSTEEGPSVTTVPSADSWHDYLELVNGASQSETASKVTEWAAQ